MQSANTPPPRNFIHKFNEILDIYVPDIQNKNIWIWGLGETTSRYQENLSRLANEGLQIQGYCDNNSSLWGSSYNGLPVISPEELNAKDNIVVLICSWQKKVIQEVGAQLTDMKKEWHTLDKIIFNWHQEKIKQCYSLLIDEFSKETFSTMLIARCLGGDKTASSVETEKFLSSNMYLAIPAFTKIDKNEIYIDCGAYVGDTIEQYLFKKFGTTKRIIAFEPNKENFSALSKRRRRLLEEWNMKEESISIHPYAVGDKNEMISFSSEEQNNASGSRIDNTGTEKVKMVSLDTFLEEPYSQIKIDVMGSEYAVLLGAQNGIRKWKPNIAVNLSYGCVDVYEIPLLLHKFVPEYKFAVRHHRNNMCMTLYAWVDNI